MTPHLLLPSIEEVDLTFILDRYGLTINDLFEKTREEPYPECRYMCGYYLFKKGYTQGQIANYFKMDRSTFSTGIEKIKVWVETYEQYRRVFSTKNDVP